MWAHLQRCGIPVTRCSTVERLMRVNGWRGVTRTTKVRTTGPDPAAARAEDLVHRRFAAVRPDELHVADFTYVPMACGFGYTAFAIDAFAGMIVGWECPLSKQTAFVERAVRQAAARRCREGHPLGGTTIHHSDAGSQPRLNRSSQHRLVGATVAGRRGLDRAGAQRALLGRVGLRDPARPMGPRIRV